MPTLTAEHPRHQEGNRQRQPEAREPFNPETLFANIARAREEWIAKEMPVAMQADKVQKAIRSHNTIFLESAPGSGKSTAGVVLMLEELLKDNPDAKIAITQPRRFATADIPQYLGSLIGDEFVDFAYKDHPARKPNARIVFTVEQSMLNNLVRDELLTDIDLAVIDEGGLKTPTQYNIYPRLKRAQQLRKERGLTPLKIVIASGTMDKQVLKPVFPDAFELMIEGTAFEVEQRFANHEIPVEKIPQDAAEKAAAFFNDPNTTGHFLILMPGKGEIDETKELTEILLQNPNVEIVTVMGGNQNSEAYKKVNQDPGNKRLCIVGTKVLRESVTINNLMGMYSSGLDRKPIYDPQTRITSLMTVAETQAEWEQGMRRVGRMANGIAFAGFTREQLQQRPAHDTAEFLRSDLTAGILELKATGITDVHSYDYVQHPGEQVINNAIESLQKLGALDKDGNLTDDPQKSTIGKEMAEFDEDPHYARMLIEAKTRGCVDAVATLIGFMKAQGSVFQLRRNASETVTSKFGEFIHVDPDSDFITALNVWNDYIDNSATESAKMAWKQKGLWPNTMDAVVKEKINLIQDQKDFFKGTHVQKLAKFELSEEEKKQINLCIAAGFADRVLVKDSNRFYKFADEATGTIQIDRSSVFANKHPNKLLSGKFFSREGNANSSMNLVYNEEELFKEFKYLQEQRQQQEQKKQSTQEVENQSNQLKTEHNIAKEAEKIHQQLLHEPSHNQTEKAKSLWQEVKNTFHNFSEGLKNTIKKIMKFLHLSK